MKYYLMALSFLIALPGCTATRLRNGTIDQASTLTELQYQQVLNNLAMFCDNPSALPWQVNLRDGSAQVADVGSASLLLDLHRAIVSHPSLLGSRTVVEQWGMSPVTDDNELKLLRMAYRRAIGIDESLESNDKDFANDLAHELAKQSPDLDDFRGDVDKYYAELVNQERAKSAAKIDLPKLFSDAFNANPLPLNQAPELANYFHPQKVYSKFGSTTHSIGDETLILDGEEIAKLDVWGSYNTFDIVTRQYSNDPDKVKRFAKEYQDHFDYYNNSPEELDKKFLFRSAEAPRLVTRYGTVVNCMTPEAADVRRQVKDIQKDLLEIDPARRWFCQGQKKDIPKDACYVGRHRDKYVWVCADGREDLTKFTLKVLKFSSLIKESGVITIPGPRFTPASSFPSH